MREREADLSLLQRPCLVGISIRVSSHSKPSSAPICKSSAGESPGSGLPGESVTTCSLVEVDHQLVGDFEQRNFYVSYAVRGEPAARRGKRGMYRRGLPGSRTVLFGNALFWPTKRNLPLAALVGQGINLVHSQAALSLKLMRTSTHTMRTQTARKNIPAKTSKSNNLF